MAIIYTYPTKATPASDDLVLISDSADGNKTKQVKMSNMPGASGVGITQLNGQTLATQSFANDANVTITSAAGTHTLGWTGTLAYTRGGTGLATLGTKYQRLQVNNSATGLEYVDPIVSEVVQNESGSTITKGTPVSISAWNVGVSLSEVIPSLANTASAMPCAGVLNEDIVDGSSGVMLLSGALEAFDTSAITGSPNEGDVVYVAPTGGFTGTKPTGNDLIQNIGVVTRNAGAGLGSIQIYTTGEVDDIPNVGAEGSIWLGDVNGASRKLVIGANNTVLTCNGTTASWGAVDLTSDVTGALPIANGGSGQTTRQAAIDSLTDAAGGTSGFYFTTDGTNATWETLAVNLTTDVSGVLPVANGGTGAATFSSGYFLTGNGTSAVAAQQYIDMTSDVTGITPIANGGTASASTTYCSLTANVSGILPIANGGTGLSIIGTKNQVLKSNGSGALYYSDLNSSFVNLTSAAAVAWDLTSGDNAYLAITTGANVLTINNATDGDTGTLILDGGASTTFSLPNDTNIKSIIAGGTSYTPSANEDKLSFVCRVSAGTTYFYWSIDANMQIYVP